MLLRSTPALLIGIMLLTASVVHGAGTTTSKSMRAPAYPLVVHDPYFSIWSGTDKLTDEWPKHWTGTIHAMCGMMNVDGKSSRWMGVIPKDVPAATQTLCTVTPTRTTYAFEADGARLTVSFFTPAFPENLDVMSRPITYVIYVVESTDGKPHKVWVYLDASAEIAVNHPTQQVQWSRLKAGALSVMRLGTVEQPVLAKRGDDLRIDWGHLYLACAANGTDTCMGEAKLSRETFAKEGKLPASDDGRMPRAVNDEWPALASAVFLGVDAGKAARQHVMICYDDQWSIEYMHRRLRPYWRRGGMEMPELLQKAEAEWQPLFEQSQKYDAELSGDAGKIGGECFQKIVSLAHRQCIGAHKLVADFDGTPLFFSKENFSNGCIATVDVTYPSAPMFLMLNPTLLKGMTTPIMDYASSPRWKFPFAPHDLGTYPLANGQVYGGGEKDESNQMPVEECGTC